MKIQKKMKKSNYVVWPAPSSKFLKMARGPKSLATPDVNGSRSIEEPVQKERSLIQPNLNSS